MTVATPASSVLRRPAFRNLLAGRSIFQTADVCSAMALTFAILDATGSATQLGIVVASRTAATILASLIGGVIADRFSRTRILAIGTLAVTASSATVAFVVLSGSATTARLALLSTVIGVVSALTYPAAAALVPATVDPVQFRPANAMVRLGNNTASVLGASLGGSLSGLASPGFALSVAAALFGLAAAAMLRLDRQTKIPAPEPGQQTPRAGFRATLREMRQGWAVFLSHRWLLVVAVCFAVYNAAEAGGVRVLGPLGATRTFGASAWGLIITFETAGMILGALLVLRVKTTRLLRFGSLCTLASGGFLLALAAQAPVPVLMAAALVEGAALEIFIVSWTTSVQEHIDDASQARVYSIDGAIGMAAVPTGQLAAGPLVASIGLQGAFLAAAIALIAAAVIMALSPSVYRLPHREAA